MIHKQAEKLFSSIRNHWQNESTFSCLFLLMFFSRHSSQTLAGEKSIPKTLEHHIQIYIPVHMNLQRGCSVTCMLQRTELQYASQKGVSFVSWFGLKQCCLFAGPHRNKLGKVTPRFLKQTIRQSVWVHSCLSFPAEYYNAFPRHFWLGKEYHIGANRVLFGCWLSLFNLSHW